MSLASVGKFFFINSEFEYILDPNKKVSFLSFRVPMNMITCTVLLSLNLELFAQDKRIIFLFCLVLSIAGLLVFKNFTRALAATNHKVVNDSDLDENTERVNLLPDENDDS